MVSLDLAPVLVSLITAVAGYLTGYRKGRKVYRSGDYLPRKRPGDTDLWPPPKKS